MRYLPNFLTHSTPCTHSKHCAMSHIPYLLVKETNPAIENIIENLAFPSNDTNDKNRGLARVFIAVKDMYHIGYLHELRNEFTMAEKIYAECWNTIKNIHQQEDRNNHFIDEVVEFFISSNAVYLIGRLSLVRSKISGPNLASSMMNEYMRLLQGDRDATTCEVASRLLHEIGNLLVDRNNFNFGIHFHMEAYRLERFTEKNDDRNIIIANSLNCIGEIHGICGRYKDAMRYFQKATQEIQSLSFPHNGMQKYDSSFNSLFDEILCNVGNIHDKLGNHSKALDAFEIVLRRRTEILGCNHSDVALAHYKVGTTLLQSVDEDVEHRLDRALKHLEDSLIIVKAGIENYPGFVAQLYHHIGNIYQELKMYTAALDNYDNSIHVIRKSLGDDHIDAALVLYNIGEVHSKIDCLRESIISYKEALRLMKLNIGDVSYPVANCLAAIGGVYLQLGKNQEARNVFEDSATITELITEGLQSRSLEVSVTKSSLKERKTRSKFISAAAA
mmetsp:Transcript_7127/g.8199  ORF Transcript_7127/g.8199 Transcript_7127/m.8199 type:complete len:502 (-) Transcript_7127:38-1543(-)